MLASRTLARPAVTSPRATYRTSREILPLGPAGTGVEAEMEHEYLPFSVAKLTFGRYSPSRSPNPSPNHNPNPNRNPYPYPHP